MGSPPSSRVSDAVAGGVAAQQYVVAGLEQQRGDRRADGAGTDQRNVGSNSCEITPPLRLCSRSSEGE